jgi:PPOX class probable F420-dependent enzyme
MEIAEMRRRFTAARVARLATVRPDGRPHVVPVCFAIDGDRVVSVVDDKPKRSAELARLANVRAQPAVSLLVDEYDDDWSHLWWVRVDGTAAVVDSGADHERAAALLATKYAQYAHYRDDRPPGAALVVTVERWSGWSA